MFSQAPSLMMTSTCGRHTYVQRGHWTQQYKVKLD
jgi:hypothetical protein